MRKPKYRELGPGPSEVHLYLYIAYCHKMREGYVLFLGAGRREAPGQGWIHDPCAVPRHVTSTGGRISGPGSPSAAVSCTESPRTRTPHW